MKKLFAIVAVAALCASSAARASQDDFPNKGWHEGAYITVNGGLMQENDDRHAVTRQKFNGTINPTVGFTFGWDIADWIGPFVTGTFGWSKGTVGTPTGAGGTFGPGTFPIQNNVMQYDADVLLGARATLPYFTRASWQPDSVKIIPYAKLGGVFHGMFVNASNNNNKMGSIGGGPAVGLGVEFMLWKGLIFTLDAVENLTWRKGFTKTISGTPTKITDSGFKPYFTFNGGIGWHF